MIRNRIKSCLNTFHLLSIFSIQYIPTTPPNIDNADAVIATTLILYSCPALNVENMPGSPSAKFTVVVFSVDIASRTDVLRLGTSVTLKFASASSIYVCMCNLNAFAVHSHSSLSLINNIPCPSYRCIPNLPYLLLYSCALYLAYTVRCQSCNLAPGAHCSFQLQIFFLLLFIVSPSGGGASSTTVFVGIVWVFTHRNSRTTGYHITRICHCYSIVVIAIVSSLVLDVSYLVYIYLHDWSAA